METIKFKGELSKDSKKVLAKQVFKASIYVSIFSTVFTSAFILLLAFAFSLWFLFFFYIPIIFSLCLLISPFVTPEPTTEVLIQDYVIYITYGGKVDSDFCRDVQDVQRIIDFGEGYYISFKFPRKFYYCYCQKDLLVEGSIEEFEKLFQDKIKIINKA